MTSWDRSPIKALILIPALLVAGCVSTPRPATGLCAGETWQETKLFFGRDIPSGGPSGGPSGSKVTETQWRAFLRGIIVPRFAAGFTVLDGAGFWLDSDSATTVGEESKVLIVVHPDEEGARKKLEEVADAYVERFDQEAVLGVSQAACVTFHSAAEAAQ